MASFCTSYNLFGALYKHKLIANSLNARIVNNIVPLLKTREGITANVLVGQQPPVRHSSFRSSRELNPATIETDYPKIEVLRNPPEWKYVERLLAPKIVPQPTLRSEYPSEWRPQQLDKINNDLPYFVERTKNHMIPVYIIKSFRGTRTITKLRRIEGDIWALESELKQLIENRIGKRIVTRVNEMSGQIEFKGDCLTIIHDHLMSKGL